MEAVFLLIKIWARPNLRKLRLGTGYSLQVLVPSRLWDETGLWAFRCYPSRVNQQNFDFQL